MMFRKIAVAAAAIAALYPAISSSSPERVSVKACASAFATSIAAPGTVAPAYKLAYRGSVGSALADFYPTDYSFVLEARDPKTGEAIARARCSTNSHGAVTGISAVPLNEKPNPLAARF